MTSLPNKYISALVHNTNLLDFGQIDFQLIQRECDSRAIPSVYLLLWSKFLSTDVPFHNNSWIQHYPTARYYPHFRYLCALIKGKVVDDHLVNGNTVRTYRKEIMFLKHIYKNVKPDKQTMFSMPLIVDLFGDVHEKYDVEIKEPKILKWWNLPPKYREEPSWINH